MADETTPNNEQQPDIDYVAALTELREKSIPKEQYAKLKAENAQLLRSLINGEKIEGIGDTPTSDVPALRQQLFGGEVEMNNLEYVTKALELRYALIADGKPDPFLPYGEKIAPSNEDIEAAERVAQVLRECIEYAAGDSAIFTNELQRVMIDTGPKGSKNKII